MHMLLLVLGGAAAAAAAISHPADKWPTINGLKLRAIGFIATKMANIRLRNVSERAWHVKYVNL